MSDIEELLALSNATIESAQESFYWIDIDGSIIRVNESACRSLGYNKEEFQEIDVYDIYPELREGSWSKFWDRAKKVRRVSNDLFLKAKDGRLVPVFGTSIFVQLGKKEFICGFAKDISDRIEAENELRASEEKYRSLIEISVQGILIYRKFIVLYANQIAADILGYDSPEEMIGIDLTRHMESEKVILETIARNEAIIRGEQISYSKEIRARRRDGSLYWVERTVTPISWEGATAVLTTFNDVSKYKDAEKALETAKTEVENLKNRLQDENIYLQEEIKNTANFDNMIGSSDGLKSNLRIIEKVGPTNATVLLLGESGTGKELLARAIHQQSDRSNRPLVKVDCASFSENLIENELFGHDKEAFTGANSRKTGRFELANEGTIFLDEIGELPSTVQAKFLRFLQDGEFERLGSSRTINVDVRVIAATNRDLQESVRSGDFRDDLYFRLNVFPIYCPPLRERKDDIPLLVEHFVKKYCTKIGRDIKSVSKSTMNELMSYSWPGNIRELENVIERGVILATSDRLEISGQIDFSLRHKTAIWELQTIKEMESRMINQALNSCKGVIAGKYGAATILDIPTSTLRRRIIEYEINIPKVRR